ncbi:MAG: hypothetical protein R3C53_06315 [Pirellulaceae bacterium]
MNFGKNVACACIVGLCLTMVGCADNPGAWPAEKAASYVKEALIEQGVEVTEISLTPKADGGFEGKAKESSGETLKLIITQDAANRRLTWDAKGDRGSFLDGSYELK